MVKTTSPVMRNDVLLDIATFLARRWSGNDKVVVILFQINLQLPSWTRIRSFFLFSTTILALTFKNIGSGV